jgi:hypothetical protein
MNAEFVGNKKDRFTVILKERYIKALSEKNITNIKKKIYHKNMLFSNNHFVILFRYR